MEYLLFSPGFLTGIGFMTITGLIALFLVDIRDKGFDIDED